MEDMIGFLRDEGYSDGEIDDMISPMDAYEGRAVADSAPAGEAGSVIHDAVRAVLERDDRPAPRPQVVVGAGARVLPGEDAVAVRVDTEDTYPAFRRGGGELGHGSADLPDISDDWTVAIEEGQRQELMGETEVGYGIGPTGDQACIACGRAAAGSAVCAACRAAHAKVLNAVLGGISARSGLLGIGERGPASDIYGVGYTARQMEMLGTGAVGFGERGAASDIYTTLGYTARQMELMGYTARQMEMIGWTARQMELIDSVDALEQSGGDGKEDLIGLQIHSGIDDRHLAAWKHGPNLYSSIRVVGWDGEPRILSAAAAYGKHLGVVVGLASAAGVPASQTLAMMDAVAKQRGAGMLIPRLAGAAPGALQMAKFSRAPFITAAVRR